MSLNFKRYVLALDAWTQICSPSDECVTIENTGSNVYQGARIVASELEPSLDFADFRSIPAGRQQTFTNIEEGTILWARAVGMVVSIEVIAQ
jgi:hypothetical protein